MKVEKVIEKSPKPVACEKTGQSKGCKIKIIAESILQTIALSSLQATYDEIINFQDRALTENQNIHPEPNEFISKRDEEMILDKPYKKCGL